MKKYKTGAYYGYPGSSLSLEMLQAKLGELDEGIARELRHQVMMNPIADVSIARMPPLAAEVFDPDDIPKAMTVPRIRFRREEFRVVLWKCLEGDEE